VSPPISRWPIHPLPHGAWCDSKGNVFTLEAFKVKAGNGEKREWWFRPM